MFKSLLVVNIRGLRFDMIAMNDEIGGFDELRLTLVRGFKFCGWLEEFDRGFVYGKRSNMSSMVGSRCFERGVVGCRRGMDWRSVIDSVGFRWCVEGRRRLRRMKGIVEVNFHWFVVLSEWCRLLRQILCFPRPFDWIRRYDNGISRRTCRLLWLNRVIRKRCRRKTSGMEYDRFALC
jgi:hypothetical protein